MIKSDMDFARESLEMDKGRRIEKMIKNFNLYKHPKLGIRAVKTGFCWPAFFFTYIWALFFSRLQYVAAFSFFVPLILWILVDIFFPANVFVAYVGFLIAIAINFLLGYKGNSWREKDIIRQGFDFIGVGQFENMDKALVYLTNKEIK